METELNKVRESSKKQIAQLKHEKNQSKELIE